MAVKVLSAKNVDWGKASFIPSAKRTKTKVDALKEAKKFSKFFKYMIVVPEISYGSKRPFSYTIVGVGLK